MIYELSTNKLLDLRSPRYPAEVIIVIHQQRIRRAVLKAPVAA